MWLGESASGEEADDVDRERATYRGRNNDGGDEARVTACFLAGVLDEHLVGCPQFTSTLLEEHDVLLDCFALFPARCLPALAPCLRELTLQAVELTIGLAAFAEAVVYGGLIAHHAHHLPVRTIPAKVYSRIPPLSHSFRKTQALLH